VFPQENTFSSWGWGLGGFAIGALACAAIARSSWGYPAITVMAIRPYGYGYGYPAYGYGYGYAAYGYGHAPAYRLSGLLRWLLPAVLRRLCVRGFPGGASGRHPSRPLALMPTTLVAAGLSVLSSSALPPYGMSWPSLRCNGSSFRIRRVEALIASANF